MNPNYVIIDPKNEFIYKDLFKQKEVGVFIHSFISLSQDNDIIKPLRLEKVYENITSIDVRKALLKNNYISKAEENEFIIINDEFKLVTITQKTINILKENMLKK